MLNDQRQFSTGEFVKPEELNSGNLVAVGRSYQRVLDQDPGNAPATQLLLQAGQAPAKPKRDEEAVKRLYYAGVEQYLAGDLAGAVDTWKKVLGQEPDHLDAKRSLARAELELEALRKRGKS